MARPPRKSDESPPPAGIGHNSGEAPDPENGDKPPPVTPPLFPSSKQGSEEIPEADRAYARLAVKYKLQPTSPTTRQLLENLDMPLETFVGQYRVGRILKEFPGELQRGTVRDVLESGNTKARKFLTDGRFHR